jgi:hypothetical protein
MASRTLFHIAVTPIPDEPLVTSREQALAGLEWLNRKLAGGQLVRAKPFPQTGGYMIADIPIGDPVRARQALDALLGTYPLKDTVGLVINIELETLEEGFEVLLAAIDARERINV